MKEKKYIIEDDRLPEPVLLSITDDDGVPKPFIILLEDSISTSIGVIVIFTNSHKAAGVLYNGEYRLICSGHTSGYKVSKILEREPEMSLNDGETMLGFYWRKASYGRNENPVKIIYRYDDGPNYSFEPAGTGKIYLNYLREMQEQLEDFKDALSFGNPDRRETSPVIKQRRYLFKQIHEENPYITKFGVAMKATDRICEEIETEFQMKNPDWNITRVSLEARLEFSKQYGQNEFSERDVENDFKRRGWNWK